MEQLLVLKNETVLRTNVITYRTGDEFFGIAKALMIENLKEKMRNGIAHFIFKKKDGSLREAWGTTQSSLVKNKINGRGENRESFFTTVFWDVECGEFRSFRWESLVKVF